MSVFTLKSLQGDRYINQDVRASRLFPVLAFDETNELFLNDDNTIGFVYLSTPLTGSDEKIHQQVEALLNEQMPKDATSSHMLLRSPDLNAQIYSMLQMRDGNSDPTMRRSIRERAKFINCYTQEDMVIETSRGYYNLGTVHDLKSVHSYKFPIKASEPTPEEVERVLELRTKIETTMKNLHLRPVRIGARGWLKLMAPCLNQASNASWRAGNVDWDPNTTLNQQVLDYDCDIEVNKNFIRSGETYIKAMSAKRLPKSQYFGEALAYAGDMSGGSGGVRTNFAVIVNIIYVDVDGLKQNIERKRQFAVNQASGPIVKFAPVIKDKEADLSLLYDSIQEGKRPLKLSYHVIVWGRSKEDVESAAIGIRNQWRTLRFEMMTDSFIQLPIFINCLPLCCDAKAMLDLQRYKTLTSKEASTVLPIFGEWKGTGTPHVNLFSRNGQLMTLSLHDTNSNMNALVCAQSGSGKSYLMNELLLSYLSEGSQAFVIDVGRSYTKVGQALGADEMVFKNDSDVCLNPFQLAISLDGTDATRDPKADLTEQQRKEDEGDEDTLVSLLEAMAAPTDGLSDRQVAALKKALRDVWVVHYQNTTIDLIADKLLENDDRRLKDVGAQLEPFTSRGSYGRFFVGQNNIDFKSSFQILELEELKSRKHLQSVVLLQLLMQINKACYFGDRGRKKLIVVDESWDLLKGSGDSSTGTAVPRFLEAAYRRMRKVNASVVMITQSVADLYTSDVGRAIAENSATMMLLGQRSESIDRVRKNDQLALSDWAAEQLKTVHTVPGVYSEIYVMSSYGQGIGRLISNEFSKLLYSTHPDDVAAIQKRVDRGMSTEEAINDILKERNIVMNYPELGTAS